MKNKNYLLTLYPLDQQPLSKLCRIKGVSLELETRPTVNNICLSSLSFCLSPPLSPDMIRLSLVLFALFIIAVDSEVIRLDEVKAWKRVIKTRTNVLALFAVNGEGSLPPGLLPMLEEVAEEVRGIGAVAYIDCNNAKKLCKNLKVVGGGRKYYLKHYKDGTYHKDYDRLLRKSSILDFMKDPLSEAPWSEDPTSKDVRHIETSTSLYKILGKERKPLLIMFYVPWCGHCQQLKPQFAAAASKLKGKYILAGMNLDKPETMLTREEYNITGFPTVLYYEEGRLLFPYTGGRDTDSIVQWMNDPQPPPAREEPEQEPNWSNELPNVVHLTGANFRSFVESNPSVLVTFYAPWCGHCKAMKPHYNEAAKIISDEESPAGVLAAVDATAERELATTYGVDGYPTIKYFSNGKELYDYGYPRTTEGFVEFMKNPQPPPEKEKDWSEMETGVHHLTDETYNAFIKKTKHLLVMYYAPWCGHCKAAKPHFIEAAQELKSDKKTALAAIDCTKYRQICDKNEVQGYPTILYMSYGKKSFKYMGPRDSSGFIEFLRNPDKYVTITKDEF